MITNLQLMNITAFTEQAIGFAPGITIFIGENSGLGEVAT